MSYHDQLTEIFLKFDIGADAQAELRHLFAIARKDAERSGYLDGWGEGQSHCDRDR